MHTRNHKYSKAVTAQKVTAITGWLTEKKAKNLLALDLSKESSLSEAVIIVTATSIRHGQGLADHVLQSARGEKFEYLRMEGYTVGQWILMDLNDVVVHIFQPDSRELFRLDDLWPAAAVLVDNREEA